MKVIFDQMADAGFSKDQSKGAKIRPKQGRFTLGSRVTRSRDGNGGSCLKGAPRGPKGAKGATYLRYDSLGSPGGWEPPLGPIRGCGRPSADRGRAQHIERLVRQR